MARQRPRLLRWLALAVLAVLLAACSSNPKTAAPPSSTSASAGGSSTSSSSTPPTANPRNWTIKSVDSSGATWTTTVAIASVISGDALTGYPTLYGNPCKLDPKTDAIVPFQITTTSTTSGDLTASGVQNLKIVKFLIRYGA